MRFGKRSEEVKRAPMRFGKRAPMRFGKREYFNEIDDSLGDYFESDYY